MKKLLISIINTFGLVLMLLSSLVFIKNVTALDSDDLVYKSGFIVGAFIPILIGYLLFRYKLKNSELKELLYEFVYWYETYERASQENLKEILLSNKKISLEKKFYYLKISTEERIFNFGISFTYGEALALKSYMTRQIYTQKSYLLDLEPKREATIESIELKDILEDEKHLESLSRRITSLSKYTKKDINKISDKASLLWSFESFEPFHLVYDEKFVVPTHTDSKLPFGIANGYEELIDENGFYGVTYANSFKKEQGIELVVPFEYYYIKVDQNALAEVQKDEQQDVKTYKDYTCDVMDLKSGKIISSNAIVNSLSFGTFVRVDENELLEFVTIDTDKREVKSVSKKFETIMLPFSHQLKPIQDRGTKLWGYIDREGHEIIECKYSDWNFFNDGYCVLEENGNPYVIDLEENIVVPPEYEKIKHYKENLFFVKKDAKWAVLKDGQIYVEFMKIDEDVEGNLKKEISNIKREHHSKRYDIPLKEYVKFFDEFKSDRDLREAGIWGHKVIVKEIPESFEEIIDKNASYYIGWEYPSSASLYDMNIEMPVMFRKKDDSTLSLGIMLEHLELQHSKTKEISHEI